MALAAGAPAAAPAAAGPAAAATVACLSESKINLGSVSIYVFVFQNMAELW